MLRSFFSHQPGQGLTEYGIILVLIALVVIGLLMILGQRTSGVFSQINSGVSRP